MMRRVFARPQERGILTVGEQYLRPLPPDAQHRFASAAFKNRACGCCGRLQMGWYDRKVRRVCDLSRGDKRIFLELEVRPLDCRKRLCFLADNERHRASALPTMPTATTTTAGNSKIGAKSTTRSHDEA